MNIRKDIKISLKRKLDFLPEPILITDQVWSDNVAPLVNISCLTYNHEPYIRDAINGFLIQKTTFKVRVVIFEDCSTDRTAEILREYESLYPHLFKIFFMPENTYGRSIRAMAKAPFNRERANSKYVAMCEGDDYWTDPLKLQKQINFLEANPEFSLCFHNAWVIYEKNQRRQLFKKIRQGEYTGEDILREWTIPTASVVYRKDLLNTDILVNQNYLFSDIILFLSLAESGKLMGLEEPMSVYRRHEGGVSFGKSPINRLRLIIKHHKEISKNFSKRYKQVEKINISSIYFQLSYEYLKKGNFRFLMAFFLSIYYAPRETVANIAWNIQVKLGLKSTEKLTFR